VENQEKKPEPSFDYSGENRSVVKFWDGVGIALAIIAGQFIAVFIAVFLALIIGYRNMDDMMSFTMLVALPLGFLIAVWLVLRKRILANTAWRWSSSFWILLPVGMVLMYCVNYVIGAVLELLPGYDEMFDQYSSMFDNINPIILVFAGAFIGPVCEEIIFRGVILKEFLKSYNAQKAIFYSAIIFGVIHMIPLQVIGAFFAGLVLGYVYFKTKSLWLPVIMHVLHNLIAFIMGVEEDSTSGFDWFGSELLYLGSFLGASGLAFAMYLLFEKWSNEGKIEQSVT